MQYHPRPWEKLASQAEAIGYLERRQQLNEDIDAILETCIREHRSLRAALDVVFQCMMRSLGPTVVFLRTFDEELRMRVFSNGVTAGMLEFQVPELLLVGSPTRHTTTALDWYVIPLDMSGETIGSFGVAYPIGMAPDISVIFDLMKVVSEELDNYFYAIQESRRKHLIIVEIQKAVAIRVLRQAIDRVVQVLVSAIPIQDLFLIYAEEDRDADSSIRYHLYMEGVKVFDSVGKQMPELELLIQQHRRAIIDLENQDFERIFPADEAAESFPLIDLISGRRLGKLIVRPLDGSGLAVSSREILHVFIESLLQRLVDFNRERNWLRQSFSPRVTESLLREPDYHQRFLSPRRAEVGILMADLHGFTAICEQVLITPERITSFIDRWSHGVVRCLYDEGGALDRIAGDSVLGLFGPPFFRYSSIACVDHLLRAAIQIRSFTTDFLKLPEFDDLRKSTLSASFGVSIGLNLCPANVGLIGPDQAFTAFGSGINDAISLQHIAQTNQILVMHQARQVVGETNLGYCSFVGPTEISLRQHKAPLVFYRVEA